MVRSPLLRFVLLLSIVAIVLFPLYALFVVYPSFDRLLTEHTTLEAERIATLLSSILVEEQLGAKPGRVPQGFIRRIQDLMQDTRILKIKVFSSAGRVLYSTVPEEIGRINAEEYFHTVVRTAKGRVQEIAKDAPTLEKQILSADVVETYVPLVKDGKTVGVFEVYYDISAAKEQQRQLIRRSTGSVLVLAFLLLIAVVISVLKARRIAEERQRIENALVASEHRYRALFEHAGDAIFILGMGPEDAGRIIDANRAAALTHGYTVDELTQMHITDLDTAESARKAPDLIQRISRGEWIKTELTHRRKDGSEFSVEVSAGLLEVGNERFILAFDRDISVRRQIEEGREKLISELQEALESIKTLRGMLPICASCKKIRDDKGYWNQLESFISSHTQAEFSHGLCPDCMTKLYPEIPPPPPDHT